MFLAETMEGTVAKRCAVRISGRAARERASGRLALVANHRSSDTIL